MTSTEPPHYRALRVTLALVVLAALLAAAWWTVQPGMLRLIFHFLGLPVQ